MCKVVKDIIDAMEEQFQAASFAWVGPETATRREWCLPWTGRGTAATLAKGKPHVKVEEGARKAGRSRWGTEAVSVWLQLRGKEAAWRESREDCPWGPSTLPSGLRPSDREMPLRGVEQKTDLRSTCTLESRSVMLRMDPRKHSWRLTTG